MKIALGLEYQGQHFYGWQKQPHLPTIQGALESALSEIAGETILTHAAGRTDAGVHAIQQIVHFETAVNRPLTAWVRGTNSHLSRQAQGISVLWAKTMPDDFHARFSATARSYRYFLLNRPTPPALFNQQIAWVFQPLDLNAMQQAAAFFLGTHDFSAFRAAGCQAKSPIKTMSEARVFKTQNNIIVFAFTANAFLLHQVRNCVGALVAIGKGKAKPNFIAELLKQGNRQAAPPTFSAHGLYFLSPAYPEIFQIPKPAESLFLF